MKQTGVQIKSLLKNLPKREYILDHIFDNLKQSLVLVNKNLDILFFNKMAKDYALELLGKQLNYGDCLWDIIPAKNKEACQRILKKVHVREQVTVTVKQQSTAGILNWFEYTINPLTDEFGELEFIIINGIDISHLKATEHKIRESEAKYKVIVQSQSEMICRFNLQGTITFVNNAYCNFFGVAENEIIGSSFYHRIPEFMREKAKSDIMSLSPANPHLNYVVEVSGAEGQKCWISGTNIANFDNDGNIFEIQVVAKDITEQKETQDKLIKALEKAKESDRIKAAFLANMSHEIRTPLNGILGFSSLIKSSIQTDDNLYSYCDFIEESSKQLLSIIDDILEISLIETKQLSIKNTNIYLPNIINNLFDYFKNTLDDETKKNIKLKKFIPVSGPNFVSIDGIRLYEVFMKLLNNALKFTHSGHIEFGYYQSRYNTVRFFVRDTGIGISHEKHNIIFKAFRQADESSTRVYGGTGLGLSIAKALVEKMGGKLSVASELNSGSNFYFDLPIVEPEEYEKIRPPKKESELVYNWKGKKFLIVEDIYINFIILREFLKRTNAVILPANTGNLAVDILEKNPDIDLILLDIMLPDISGYEVARRIKKTNPTIPIIAQTANFFDSDRQEAFKAGCDGFLSKPIDRIDLLETINEFMKVKP